MQQCRGRGRGIDSRENHAEWFLSTVIPTKGLWKVLPHNKVERCSFCSFTSCSAFPSFVPSVLSRGFHLALLCFCTRSLAWDHACRLASLLRCSRFDHVPSAALPHHDSLSLLLLESPLLVLVLSPCPCVHFTLLPIFPLRAFIPSCCCSFFFLSRASFSSTQLSYIGDWGLTHKRKVIFAVICPLVVVD